MNSNIFTALMEKAAHKTGDRRAFWGRDYIWSGSKWEPVDKTADEKPGKAKAAKPEPEPEGKPKSQAATVIKKYRLKFTGPGHEKLAKAVEAGIDKSADLCKINPPICHGNLGITRDEMPQFPGNAVRDSFLDKIKKSGVRVTEGKVKVGQLKASQEEIQAEKTIGMAGSYLDGKFDDIKNAIVISRDGHIIDGHHRWAALLAIGSNEEMSVIRVGMPTKELLDMVNDHPGVEKRSLTAASIGRDAKEWVARLDAVLALSETRVGVRGLALTAIPVGTHGVGVSPSASPADQESGRYQNYADGPVVRRRPLGYKPSRPGADTMVRATQRRLR